MFQTYQSAARNITVIVLLLLTIVGCSSPTLTPEDCALGAWYAVGRDDGVNGTNSDILRRHQDACEKYDIAIDTAEYRRGYDEGNHEFCESKNHYATGALGEPPYSVCLREPYQSKHQEGVDEFCESFDHYQAGVNGDVYKSICPRSIYYSIYEQGVAVYCANTNAYEVGRENGSDKRICGRDFSRAYDLGKRSLQIERDIERTEERLSKEIRELIDEEDPDRLAILRDQARKTEETLQKQRRQLKDLKLEVRDLGYIDR